MTRVDDIERCASAIERYVRAHPRAADTVAGIQAWWLGDLGDEIAPSHLQAALDRLVARGCLATSRLPDGTEVYHGT